MAVSSLLNISEAASLGLHAMALLARDSRRRFINREIAEVFKASGHHLAKVMQRLTRVGLVDSIRGPHGGFLLGRPAEQVTLLEIYEAIDGPLGERACLFGDPVCAGTNCMLGQFVLSIHKQLRDYLGETTLAELTRGLAFLVPNRPHEANC